MPVCHPTEMALDLERHGCSGEYTFARLYYESAMLLLASQQHRFKNSLLLLRRRANGSILFTTPKYKCMFNGLVHVVAVFQKAYSLLTYCTSHVAVRDL